MGLYIADEIIHVVFGEGDLITNGCKINNEDMYGYMLINQNLDGCIELNYEDDSISNDTPCNKSEQGVALIFQDERDIDKMISSLQKIKELQNPITI
jgi:hypothetical protein